jgi:hypothetical protein
MRYEGETLAQSDCPITEKNPIYVAPQKNNERKDEEMFITKDRLGRSGTTRNSRTKGCIIGGTRLINRLRDSVLLADIRAALALAASLCRPWLLEWLSPAQRPSLLLPHPQTPRPQETKTTKGCTIVGNKTAPTKTTKGRIIVGNNNERLNKQSKKIIESSKEERI